MVSDPSKTEEWPTIIGADAMFKGELSFQGSVKIDGSFEGSITTPGKVFVSTTGKVKAEIQAGTLTIDGSVTGNVASEGAIVLNASCKLKGDLRAAKLQVKEGATWSGRCEVGTGAGKPSATPTAAPMRQVADAASGKK
jgi:cytoskeletal protein CcmA (bactofilin family)